MKITLTSSLPRHRRRRHTATFLMRLSRPFADTILLAQMLGIVANFIWYSGISTSDFVGFIYVGGDIAALFAYFGFILFGGLFFWLAPRRFWVSLHPLTLGVALLMLASQRLWNMNLVLAGVALAAGVLAGRYIYRWALLRPRDTLFAAVIIILLSRYTLPFFIIRYAVVFCGALLIAMVCAPRSARRQRQKQ